MQPVNVLPAFVSQETDLKNKDSSGTSAGSNKDTDFSSLVEQHLPEEKEAPSRIKSSATEQADTAIEGETIAAKGKDDEDENQVRQENGSKDSQSNSDTTQKSEATVTVEQVSIKTEHEDKNKVNQDALTESEQFISLLYNSDQTLSQSKDTVKTGENKAIVDSGLKQTKESDIIAVDVKSNNNQSQAIVSDVEDSSHLEATHKLKAFSKDELLARTQVANNSEAVPKSDVQILKDYQLSLQSKQSTIISQSITSEQLMNVQLASAQLKNNKVTDLAEGISQASRKQLTEKVDSGLYQLPVEPIGKGNTATEQVSILPEVSSVKGKINEIDNKINTLSKPQGVLSTELETEEAELQLVKKVNSLLEATNVKANNTDTATAPLNKASLDKLIAERNTQTPGTFENTSKEHIVATQIKQPSMTNSQIQALQQAQAQQKSQSANNEQQAVDSDSASDEYIESMLPAGDKAVGASVQTASKITDNIVMRSMSDIQAQAIQTTQIKQNNDAYLEHQVSEVLNHNVASDTAQIQKNNVQLQQETVSIFRKDFADVVKDKVMITINQKLQQFDITLDPPEFGNMQVRVNLQGEQASVNFVVQNQQAKDALEQNMHKLRDMLSEQGVDVGGANVEQQNQERNTDEQGLSKNNATGLADGTNAEEGNVEHVLSAQLFDSSATSVDYYA